MGTVSSSFTASYSDTAVSSSYALSASISDKAITASFGITASFAQKSVTASYVSGGNVVANSIVTPRATIGTSSLYDVTIDKLFVISSTFGKEGLSGTQSFNGLVVLVTITVLR